MAAQGRGVVSGFEAGVRAGSRAGAANFSHGSADGRVLIGRAHDAAAIRQVNGRRFAGALLAPLQLVLPIALLMTISAAAFLYGDVSAGLPDIAPWLTLGDLLVPLTFLAIHITNRRYGAGHALAQVIGAWAFGFAAIWAERSDLGALVSQPLPAMREMLAFGGALFLAQIMSVAVFDGMRGPKWWAAPLYASFWASVILCVAGFPAAYAGTATGWILPMLVYLAVTIVEAIAMLVPYWAIRAIVPPLSGFGGY
jgi:uncharacterized PurR-regulated membrane protein YhhQ (DUF165 family)